MDIIVAENLKKLREKHNLTQEALALEWGVPELAIYKWEAGRLPIEYKVLVKIANFYITIIRGTPLMILALFLYFGVIKDSLPLVMSASLILGLNASAFMAEIFRAGIQAIDYGQMEAARSLGLSYGQTMRKIILPQAFKIMIPSLMNQFISSIKDTAILSAISVNELTMVAKTIIARNFKAFEIYSYAAIIYIVVITALTFLSKYVERRLAYDKR